MGLIIRDVFDLPDNSSNDSPAVEKMKSFFRGIFRSRGKVVHDLDFKFEHLIQNVSLASTSRYFDFVTVSGAVIPFTGVFYYGTVIIKHSFSTIVTTPETLVIDCITNQTLNPNNNAIDTSPLSIVNRLGITAVDGDFRTTQHDDIFFSQLRAIKTQSDSFCGFSNQFVGWRITPK